MHKDSLGQDSVLGQPGAGQCIRTAWGRTVHKDSLGLSVGKLHQEKVNQDSLVYTSGHPGVGKSGGKSVHIRTHPGTGTHWGKVYQDSLG